MTETKKKNRKRGVVDAADVTDLVVQEQMAPSIVHADQMADINIMLKISSELDKGGMFRKTAGSAAAIFTIALLGHEHGLSPMKSLNAIHNIQGNLGFHYSFIQGKLEKAGCVIDVLEYTDDKCVLEFSGREGKKNLVHEYTMAEAKKAGKVTQDGNYDKMPKVMLYARCITRGGRMYHPGAILGMYEVSETETMEPRDKPASIGTLSASQMGSGDPDTVKPYDDPADEAVDRETGEIQPTETPETTDVDPKGTKVDLTDGKEDTGPVDDEPVDKSGLGKRKVYPGTEPETKPEAPVEPEVEPEESVGPDKDDVIVSVIGLETTKDYGETSRKDLRMSQVGQLELSSLDVGVLVEYENYLTSLPGKEEF